MDVPLTVGDKRNKISGACCSLKFLKVLLSKECWTSLLKEQIIAPPISHYKEGSTTPGKSLLVIEAAYATPENLTLWPTYRMTRKAANCYCKTEQESSSRYRLECRDLCCLGHMSQ